jgi:predicted nucleic acid-binding protein
VIFDSDVVIWASRGDEAAAASIEAATERALSVVTVMELLQGARSKMEARIIQESLRQLRFRILPLSGTIGDTAKALIDEYSLAHGLQVADALIAATALEEGDQLCTANAKHFRPIRHLLLTIFRPGKR